MKCGWGRIFIALIFVIAVLGVAEPDGCRSARDNSLCPGSVTNVAIEPNSVFEFRTERALVRLEILEPAVVRVRLAPEAQEPLGAPRSVAVLPQVPWDQVEHARKAWAARGRLAYV